MAGRAFAFADPEILHLATTAFVPACADDWYQRRRTDDEGLFWKAITKQGPRSADAPTHQGIYVITADGELLEFKNAGQSAKATREQLIRGLQKWNALAPERRRPGAVDIPRHGALDSTYSRTPPKGGLIVRVHARILDRTETGYAKGTCEFPGGDQSARDFLWLTADDANAILALAPKIGESTELPAAIARRIARFHLVDNTRGEPDFWTPTETTAPRMAMTATTSTSSEREWQLNGRVALGSPATRGYEARLFGRIRIQDRTIVGFDLVAIGEHWGASAHTQSGARPGRSMLGITFELADPSIPAQRVAPQGSRVLQAYFAEG